MNASSVLVSFVLIASYIELLAGFIRTVDGRENNLRQWDNNRDINPDGGIEIEDAEKKSRSLIVGGNPAREWPLSIVFLSDREDDLSCGGTLISPTVVLLAGHCRISLISDAVFLRSDHPHDPNRNEDGMGLYSDEEIRIPVRAEILHPDYDHSHLINDVMLVVLEYSPNNIYSKGLYVPYMKLHRSDDAPLEEIAVSLEEVERLRNGRQMQSYTPEVNSMKIVAFGWGHTSGGVNATSSETLQEVTVNYVVNDECKKAASANMSYSDRITDDMMCTWGSDKDTCHGDSGGPLLLENPNYDDVENGAHKYLQIGIVSWGEDCADSIFPGVASRVSVAWDWIRDRVCSIDGATGTPSYFGCTDEHTYSPAPSMSPTTTEDKMEAESRFASTDFSTRKVAVEIFLDVYSEETSWKLVDSDSNEIQKVEFDTYEFENKIKEVFELEIGAEYTFTIYDRYGDGIEKSGSYRIYTVDGDSGGILLVEGSGNFHSKMEHVFKVPTQIQIQERAATTEDETVEPRKEERNRERIGQLRNGLP